MFRVQKNTFKTLIINFQFLITMEPLMIMCGAKITSPDDKLLKVLASYVADKLRSPKPEIEAQIRQMRDMMAIDEKKYREFKKQLPYIVTGHFAPPTRRTENFAYTEAFILDFDHLQEKGVGILSLKNLINRDSRVVMSFVSPSGDGLKVMFRLKEKLYDAGIFKVFYKEFAQKFAVQYNLTQVVDAKTCDVTRACFMSIDNDVYFNPEAEPIDIIAFIDTNNPTEMSDLMHSQAKDEKQQPKLPEPPKNIDPDAEALQKIAAVLEQKTRTKNAPQPKSQPVVPDILNEVMDGLKPYLENNGVEVYNVINIQKAKKIQIRLGVKKAEINLFTNQKRGFTVTRVDKRETDGEFNEMMRQLVLHYVETMCTSSDN